MLTVTRTGDVDTAPPSKRMRLEGGPLDRWYSDHVPPRLDDLPPELLEAILCFSGNSELVVSSRRLWLNLHQPDYLHRPTRCLAKLQFVHNALPRPGVGMPILKALRRRFCTEAYLQRLCYGRRDKPIARLVKETAFHKRYGAEPGKANELSARCAYSRTRSDDEICRVLAFARRRLRFAADKMGRGGGTGDGHRLRATVHIPNPPLLCSRLVERRRFKTFVELFAQRDCSQRVSMAHFASAALRSSVSRNDTEALSFLVEHVVQPKAGGAVDRELGDELLRIATEGRCGDTIKLLMQLGCVPSMRTLQMLK